MVLMTMSQYDTSDFFDIFCQVRHIGDDQVDTQHIILGESQTAVDDDDIITIFQHSHVFTDLFQTTQSDDFQIHLGFLFRFISRTQFCCYALCRCFRLLFYRFFCLFLRRRLFCFLYRSLFFCGGGFCFRLCVIFRFWIFCVHILCVFLLCQKTHLLFFIFSRLFL